MKEATGELSGAVVAVTCVAILVAFFYTTIWPIIDNNFKSQTACEKAVCETIDKDGDGFVKCKVKSGSSTTTIKCKFKG